MTVTDEQIRVLFDIAIGSLDWGSGFLDDDEVEHLRAVAAELAVDPMEATPPNHRPKYCPGHQFDEWRPYAYKGVGPPGGARTCQVCGHMEHTTDLDAVR